MRRGVLSRWVSGLAMLFIVGLRLWLGPTMAAELPTSAADASEHSAVFQSGPQSQPFLLGEQRNPFGSVDLPRDGGAKPPLARWLCFDYERWQLDLPGARYYALAERIECSLDPPDIVYPFHSFW